MWPDRAVIEHRANTKGRDLIAGDVHGHFETLERAIETLRFDPTADRLFGIGDLIDRDPRSEAALGWITEGRIAAVRGNHEQLLVNTLAIEHGRLGTSGHGARWLADGGR